MSDPAGPGVQQPPNRRETLAKFARERGPGFAIEILVNFILPVLI